MGEAMPNERLRDAMLKAGLAPADVAEKLGVNPKTAERWVTLDRPPYPRHRHAIAVLVRESESYLWPDALPPERAMRVAESEVVHVYPRRSAIPGDLWRRLLDQAQDRIQILVYAGLFLPEQEPKLAATLKAKAKAGVCVEILLGNPSCEAVAQRGLEEGIGGAIAEKIRNVLHFYDRLRNVENAEIRFHDTTLYNSIYRFDVDMFVNPHVLGFPAAHSPAMHLRQLSGGELFDTYAGSFERVWSQAVPAWDVAAVAG
jgi:transcriptional regulator with XRE-family HTH domain